jgi:hypothetical protein
VTDTGSTARAAGEADPDDDGEGSADEGSPDDERRAPQPNRTIATRPGRGKRDAHARGGGEDPRAGRARAS